MFIMGSFIPPLYYGFYCSRALKVLYMSMTCSLGVLCIIVPLWNKFNQPKYRIFRTGELKIIACATGSKFSCFDRFSD